MAEIVLSQVGKRFADGTVAVRDVDLTVADGELVVLVGPSGCGKSTTLEMIAGLTDITSGELRIGGVRMNERPPRARNLAMVFQSYALYPHLSVRGNLAFPLELAGLDRATIARKVTEAAELLELTALLDRRPAMLSGGQRQRVAMGRALVRTPNAFLMDEPLSNLDARLRMQMRTALARLQRRLGTTTVYVTHDQTEALTLGDRVVVMRGGVVQQVGPPDALYDRPANVFVAGFIGSPAMNFLRAEAADGRLRTALGDLPLDDALRRRLGTASTVLVGIRPEHLEDAVHVRDDARAQGVELHATIDVVESTGADRFVYFARPDGGTSDADGNDAGALVARWSPASSPAPGAAARLWVDRAHLRVFDPSTGRALADA